MEVTVNVGKPGSGHVSKKTVKALYKRVDDSLELIEVKDDYKEIQKLCGGFFSGYTVSQFVANDILRIALCDVVLYCNDTGKLDELPLNCFIGAELLVGDIVFFAFDEDGAHVDITSEQCEALERLID